MNIKELQEKLKNIDVKGFKEKLNAFLLGPQDVLGVDIGSYAIKVARIKMEHGVWQLKDWGHIPLEPRPDASPEDKKQQSINQLKAFLIRKGMQTKHAATAISGNAVIVRYVKFPLLTKTELRATLVTEAEPFIPFDIKEVHLGFHILNEVTEDGQRKMETVLVAAKKEAVQARVDVLESAGLKPAIIDVDSFALEGIFEHLREQDKTGSTLYLNLGHMVTNLSIIESDVTRVVRDIFIAGNTFTKAIMKALQYDYAKAEEVKKTHGLLIDSDEKERALQEGNRDALGVSQAVLTVMKDLVSEVHRSVDFYLSQGPERSITRIALSGGTARLKNIAKYLTGELKVPVSVVNPLSFIQNFPADLPSDVLPSMGVAAGLALRKSKDWA